MFTAASLTVVFSAYDCTVSGFLTSCRETIVNLAKEIREKFPNKNQCMYTGYTWSQILEDDTMRPILNYIDVVMDGEYVESLRDIDLQWVGSSNQNIINVKERIERIKQIGI